ncbi:MAG: TIM barrel protein [Acidobacteria bacterium]|nr:TIM barrel protein [Acidobacteriota bacterium]MBI3422196.1 TIM barrel protein [Acidobacteriota bacterium]
MLSRRTFLAAFPLTLATAPAWPLNKAESSGVKLACQTNAWRIDPQDFSQVLAVLGKLKELGFEGFETGFRNLQGQFNNAAAARQQLAQTGLQFFGAHIFLDQYDAQTHIAPMDLVQKIAGGVSMLGAQRLILSGGGLLKDGKVDAEALKRKAAGLNAAAKYCRSKGLRLAYHNHGPEFMQNGLEIEGLYRLTDPALVDFLLDCGWAARGGMNVPAFFAKHQRRIIGLHLRDFKGDTQVPLGQGDFPLKDLVAVIKRVQWRGWALNEEERLNGEKPGESAVAPARQTLRQVFGK